MNVFSSEMIYIIEADAFMDAEGNMNKDVMVSPYSLYRSLSQWHDMKWNLRELGRSSEFSQEYVGTSQQRRGLTNDSEEVGLIRSTRSLGKLSTWGRDQQ